ncbi:ATP-binding protein [Polymorphospora rubra]|uniref:HTH cro/C1-type domain-containing protein n=1 Tax=Polymorphospora rubra TaxID=338584 RepID=A0A810N889_9ACTN|nr:helix-turn-helix domain-containing protein [Polymorphospora rubra]BCJ68674.1 hypothetical protein Prubr_56950 [Polymorphospora rubra]
MAADSFGPLLRGHRHAAGLTLEELAAASGVSARAISDMERGHSRAPQHRTLAALTAALGLSPADHDAMVTAARAGRAGGTVAGGHELPRAVGDFTGRRPELDLLAALADERAGTAAEAVPVAVVHGAPGLGKTAFAVRTAERLRDRFPDGQFFVELRGTGPTPLTPAGALGRLLRALGVGGRRIAGDEAELAALYRSVLRDRQALVILDNAADEAQVRPLLPGPGHGLVIVTSRRTLAGLEGVHRIGLAPLSPAESAALLRAVAGGAAERADPDTVDEVARLCGNLPLALRIAGNRLASRPSWTMAHLAARLSDTDRRLANLTAGDLAVEAAFALSYAQLSPPARQAFRRLALVPGPDFGAPVSAVLSRTDVTAAEDALDELVDLGLLQPGVGDRYQFHDLIRLFARTRLHDEEPAAERAAAQDRMVDWLLDVALVAGRWFEPAYGPPPPGWRAMVDLDTPEQAQAWLQAEGDNWIAALRLAAAAGDHRRVVDVAEAMHWFSDRWTGWANWIDVYTLSREAARHLGDPRLQLTHVNYLAWALSECAMRHADSAAQAMIGYGIAQDLGDLDEQGWALIYASQAYRRLGDHQRAWECSDRAERRFADSGNHEGHLQALTTRAHSVYDLGRPEEALGTYQEVLDRLVDRPPSPNAANMTGLIAHICIARCLSALGRWRETVDRCEAVLAGDRPVHADRLEGDLRLWLGRARQRLGDHDEARRQLRRAVELLEPIGHDPLLDEARAELAALGGQPTG